MDANKLIDVFAAQSRSIASRLPLQTALLLRKRFAELTAQPWEIFKIVFVPFLFFVLNVLVYQIFPFFNKGGIEEFFVPIAMWLFVQRLVVNITYEKNVRLQESLRMMGLLDVSYWMSYFISDGIFLGFIVSFFCSCISMAGLFNDANFGTVLGFLFVFTLSASSFSFFLCSFFDSAQTASLSTIFLLIGLYVAFIGAELTTAASNVQAAACIIPPLALQIAAGSFKKSYSGVPLSSICGILFADIFFYIALSWYFSQVWPSSIGVRKPFYFPFTEEYWFSSPSLKSDETFTASPLADVEVGADAASSIIAESVDETLVGKPTVSVKNLKKTFDGQVAVDDFSFNMHENQIFALLGHNGAGKTTTINMLTGLISPDGNSTSAASIYGMTIGKDMDAVRRSMGVCPQHDILFENLTVREHILLVSQLKGCSYEDANAEVIELTKLFHLENRLNHLGSELSGGQKRKLSVAIAVCGGSKFIVLDEPSAGMDPLARRELWDLLTSLRKGRTILLTTHYMDEADVLGDRIGIMNLGKLQCVGSSQFLKLKYGNGYKLIFDQEANFSASDLSTLSSFVTSQIPTAEYIQEAGYESQVLFILPFNTSSKFGVFFEQLESCYPQFNVKNYGVTITSLEDVFLKVGEDHSVKPSTEQDKMVLGIGADQAYSPTFVSQIVGVIYRRFSYALHDYITLALVGLPLAVAIVVAALVKTEAITTNPLLNAIIASALYMGGYFGAPGLIAEFLVRERVNRLRNVLTVMGCEFRTYWIGTFIADYLLLSIPMFTIFITWDPADMTNFYQTDNGIVFFMFFLFTFQLISFSYACSYMFSSPQSCIAFMPIFVIVLLIAPAISLSIMILIVNAASSDINISSATRTGVLLWGITILSPHGALFTSLLNETANFGFFIDNYPDLNATIAFMIVESGCYLAVAYYLDSRQVAALPRLLDSSYGDISGELDDDVLLERNQPIEVIADNPLRIDSLRKVFPPKKVTDKPVIAVEDLKFSVAKGEIFGLLGANGAGKSTALSMITRHVIPTAGDALVFKYSVLQEFTKASKHIGLVTQNNSLWDLLSVEDHLFLFARLRGVPEGMVKSIVDGTINQLELTPHRKKLSCRLSGGMKRKLCVAIALIGDPEVVLLDEPSAGLDPVSRRNLWYVILRTMSHRAVILTTHSMEEAEALCKRIGIMVKGQIKALGTKQHLKVKFSSGYEMSFKVKHINLTEQANVLTAFVTQHFLSAILISENGGLFTYRIPKEEMMISKAFALFEDPVTKERLCIEDYSIAQPTLEQVFINTVLKHSDDASLNADGQLQLADAQRQVEVEKNCCGCISWHIKVMAIVFAVLFVVFVIAGILAKVPLVITAGVICLIVSIVGCIIYCCPCCQVAKGFDE